MIWVAPHVGAWIEIVIAKKKMQFIKSHPTWVRGLKLFIKNQSWVKIKVAPHVGAWIEIQNR